MTDLKAPYTPPFDLHRFIRENEEMLRTPPTNVKALWRDTDFIVFLVGGPNKRNDYHEDPHEEFFYQIRGDIHLDIMTDAGPGRIDIREGNVFLLPPRLLHSPQRPDPNSIGIVVERVRPTEIFHWFCKNCHTHLHREERPVTDIEKDLPPIYQAFHDRHDKRLCPNCGTFHPGKD